MRRLPLVALLVSAALVAAGEPRDCDALLRRAASCMAEHDTRTALLFWMDAVHDRCVDVEDLLVIAEQLRMDGDLAGAEAWSEYAVSISPDPDQDLSRLSWGIALAASDRWDEARVQLAAGSKSRAFELFLQLGEPDFWAVMANHDTAEAFRVYADAVRDDPVAAENYRRAAALIALRAGLLAARRSGGYAYREAIAAFLHADDLVPIDDQPVAIRMTVWRTMALGHARLGEYAHAMDSAEKLLTLCHVDAPRQTPCPPNALIPLPLTASLVPRSLMSGEWYLLEQNMKTLGYVLQRIFVSISWDPETGHPRPEAEDSDFFGQLTREGYPNGRVSPTEDQLETEMLPVSGATVEARMARRRGRFEPFVKKFVANLARDAWSGFPTADEQPAYLGVTMQNLGVEMERAAARGKVAPATKEAFELAVRAHRFVLRLIDRWNERLYGTPFADLDGNPVWESFQAAQNRRAFGTLARIYELFRRAE